MALYGNQLLRTTSSTTLGVGSLECPGSSPRRLRLSELIIGSDAATLGTSNFRFEVQRSTAAATGTAITPEPLDPADAACVALMKSNLSVQGTNTAGKIPITIPLNEQATFRWVANPGSEIVVPATANNGLHINTPVAGNTPSAHASIIFSE